MIAALALQSAAVVPTSTAAIEIAKAKVLLLGTAPAGPVLTIPRGTGKANLCATSVAADGLYPGTGIQTVTRDIPFMPFPEVNGGPCSIYSYAEPIPKNTPLYEMVFESCSVSFRSEHGRQVIDIAPRKKAHANRFILSECFYRVALYIEGYRGALQMTTDQLFDSTARGFWVGQVQWVGPLATLTPVRLSLLCPDLKGMYYTDDFAAEAIRRCIPPVSGSGDAQ
jgi:hypothetical protein